VARHVGLPAEPLIRVVLVTLHARHVAGRHAEKHRRPQLLWPTVWWEAAWLGV
jgi:hypothetical protein